MNNLKTKNVNKLIWTKSYRSHWYAFNGSSYPFTIKKDKMTLGNVQYALYFGDDFVAKFDKLQQAKNYADSINNKQEVA
jgi:hypothetical protein